MCIGFYQSERWIFFGISLGILCLACIAYDLAFVARYSSEQYCCSFCMFITLLPISPLMPFIFYFADNDESCLLPWMERVCCFDINGHSKYIPKDASKLRKFMEEKIDKHAGFIIEALVEGTLYILNQNPDSICLYAN